MTMIPQNRKTEKWCHSHEWVSKVRFKEHRVEILLGDELSESGHRYRLSSSMLIVNRTSIVACMG